MGSKMKGGGRMEKIDSKISYDDRKKELAHQINEERELKSRDGKTVVGIETAKRIGVYKEEGIKRVIKDLENEASQLKKSIREHQKDISELQDVKETNDLKKFKEIVDKGEVQELIPKLRRKEQLQNNLIQLNENLKKTKNDLNQIKRTIGTRLKL